MMPKQWAKIRADIVESKRMVRLLEQKPFAFGLYMIAKARSDDYGRLPADPDKFKARVAPMMHVNNGDIEQAIEDMVAFNVAYRYSVNGDVYLQIDGYHEIEETNWQVVGEPDCPHPSGWQAPDDLCLFIIDSLQRSATKDGRPRVFPARYGLAPCHITAHAEQVLSLCRTLAEQEKSTLSSLVLSSPVLSLDVDVPMEGARQELPKVAATKKEKPASSDTPVQAAIRKAWDATGGEGAPGGTGYGGLIALVETNGIPKVDEWSAWAAFTRLRPPDGAVPWRWFCAEFRRAMNRDFEWRKDMDAKRSKLWRRCQDGSIEWEQTMEPAQKASIRSAISAGTWDSDVGIDRLSPRHPEYGQEQGVEA